MRQALVVLLWTVHFLVTVVNSVKEACAAYEYGEYVDFAEHGCPDLVDKNYYTFGGGEAIAKGFKSVTPEDPIASIEDTAKRLASLIYGSKNHWSYIGGSNEITMACGIAWKGQTIVGVVMVSHENYG